MREKPATALCASLLLAACAACGGEERNYALRELAGVAEEFHWTHNWCSYYWREDFALRLREEGTGKLWLVISREPTPCCNWRFGTTYTGLKVDWTSKPKVKVVGVHAVDRMPAEFYGWRLEPEQTLTAFILWVDADAKGDMKELYVNNWFHNWGEKTDAAVLRYYADQDKPWYSVYGFAGGIAAPFDKAAQALAERYKAEGGKMIYHGTVHSSKESATGYELRLLHLLVHNAKTGGYDCVFGDPATLVTLDGNAPPEAKKK
ncbi:MAG: hypothetical protein NTW87_31600 [Planctomycetota bacterium]|nr:hypothetical protein [Planctomycetota bacterium]